MNNEELAVYLTYEFTQHFNPAGLREISNFKELKVWISDDSGLPVFSHGGYHGAVITTSGLIGFNENSIHIRVDRNDAANLVLALQSGNEVQCRDKGLLILKRVYEQVVKQVELFGYAFKNNDIEDEFKRNFEAINELKNSLSLNTIGRHQHAH